MSTGLSITSRDMAAVTELVYARSGIRLTDGKRALVTARLQKRVRASGFRSLNDYLAHVCADPSSAECQALIDALTTNKTSFFREQLHYDFLAHHVIPELRAAGFATLAGWSAGCATGEEPYSLAMVLVDAMRTAPDCTIDLLASDLSTAALRVATAGIYPAERVSEVPYPMLRRHFERGIGADEGRVRVRAEIRRLVRFEHSNLLEPRSIGRPRHFIWCRNTLMYFDQRAKQIAVAGLEASLARGGFLFLSHAETLSGLRHHLVQVAPAVYRRPR